MTARPVDVLIPVTVLRPEEKLLAKALRERDLLVATALGPQVGDVLNGRVPPPRLAVVRNLSHRDACDTARRLTDLGVPVVNTPDAIELGVDKGRQALAFARAGVPHPRSWHAYSADQVRGIASMAGWPVVVKPLRGSWGRGVVLLDGEPALAAWAGGLETADAAGRSYPVLVQEWVDKPEHDLRVLVVGTRPVLALRRRASGLRTNTHLGATIDQADRTPVIAGLCAAVVELFGPGFYGVDLIEDHRTGRTQVLEVNVIPEYARSSALLGVDVAGALADHLAAALRGADLLGVPA